MEAIIAMILAVAIEYQLPPNFVLAIATVNYPIESVDDIRHEWRTENGARYHARNLNELAWECYRNTWWTVALYYNMGNGMRTKKLSNEQIEYANGVIDRYADLEGGKIRVVVGYTDEQGFF